MWMVKQVKELGPELQVHLLPEVQGEILDQRKIGGYITGTVERCTGRSAQFSGGCLLKSARVKPMGDGVNLSGSRAGRVAGNRAWLVRIAHLIRALDDQ